ncbi:TIGR03943 family protein [Streptomyces sp. YS415]|uniref:TIGR03943 family putative permease subunit n=1 Tax=Streptomyces sp. YS415 TaxID=2944806 RepID=UPI002020217F|nr:TIGR03943 family protein [Streptomyces sp. YS415]MCL7428890.1 TIGR03943 family protein [Streptomyces sp. YS415]
MRRYGPAVVLLLLGAAVLRISLFSEVYLRYVQPGLRPYLVVSGVVLAVLGLVAGALVAAGRSAHAGPGPRVAWLLVLPALALLFFPPPALGSYSAEREAAQRAARSVGTFPALPAKDPVTLSLGEFSSRAAYDSERSLRGRTVRLTGFVTRDADGTWYVTRLQISCCAADAGAGRVEIRGAAAAPEDTWVTVTGTWHPEGTLGGDDAWPAVLDAESVRRIGQPANPYEQR